MTDQNEAAALKAAWDALVANYEPKDGEFIWDATVGREDLQRALTAYKQALPAAPGDWAMVPREPTPEMMAAFRLARMNVEGGYDGPSPWEAMLAAAPSAPLASTVAAPGVPEGWRPIDSAPTDGRHIRVAWLDGGVGFGIFDGKTVPMQTVAHWYGPADLPGLRAGGWYPSVQTNDSNEKLHPTHWKPLEDAPTPVAASGPTLGSEADLPRIDSFHINPKGGANIVVEGGDRFCHESDVKDYQEAVKRLLRQAPTSAGPSLVAAETEELLIKAALYDFLREQHGYSYGMSVAEPSPAEFGISWSWQQTTPDVPMLEDQLQSEAFDYYDNFVNERDPDEEPTDWELQCVKYRDALRPLTPQGEAQEKK